MKRYFEIFIVICVSSYLIYLILYSLFFPGFCNWHWWKWITINAKNIKEMAKCKDSIICEIKNVELNVKDNTVKNWSCERKKVNYFEAEYYLDYYNNL